MDESILHHYKHVLIYGAGVTGESFLRILTRVQIPVMGFLDRNPNLHGLMRGGIPVFPPDAAALPYKDRVNSCVVIAIADNSYDTAGIEDNLLELGYGKVFTGEDFFSMFHTLMWEDTNVEFPGYEYYEQNPDAVEAARLLFPETRSGQLFDAIINYKRTLDYSFAPRWNTDVKYFPTDVDGFEAPRVFVNCGAYNGSDLEAFIKRYGCAEGLIAFEPDPENFKILSAGMRAMNGIPTSCSVLLYPCALWSSTTFMGFSHNKSTASELSQTGELMMQCVALDDVAVGNLEGAYIVMDIEGAEYEALKGAKSIIERYRPALGITIMHKSSDLCEIPLLIESWNLGYRFYLRTHAPCFGNMVLYMIPE